MRWDSGNPVAWWLWPGATLLAGVLGGVLAVRFWEDLSWWLSALLVVVPALVATALSLLITVEARPARRRSPDPGLRLPPVRPIAAPHDGDGWWTETPVPARPPLARLAPPAPVAPPHRTPPAVFPLDGDRPGGPLVAQCPRCGGFRLDVEGAARQFRFGCRSCAHTWRWTAGTPWPPVIVRPTLRDHDAPGADRHPAS